MREYKIEVSLADRYKNGVHLDTQSAGPMKVTAGAHIHESIEILFVLEGGYTIYLEDTAYSMTAGDLVLIRSGVIHHVVSDAEKRHAYQVIKIRPELVRELAMPQMENAYALALSLNKSSSKCVWKKEELDKNTTCALHALFESYASDEPYSDMAIKLAAGTILLGLLRTDTAEQNEGADIGREMDKTIYEAMAHIRRHYAEEISAREMAKQFNVSYSYFSRAFKEITGRNFTTYLNAVRINHAERMLLSGDKSVSEIAAACGYNDAAYFIKVFREIKGVSPKVYKKLNLL